MGLDSEEPPQYTRYRSRRRLLGGGEGTARDGRTAAPPRPPGPGSDGGRRTGRR